MKKTLVALAAVSAVSAFAQSTVTLSGNLDFAGANVGGTQAWAKGQTVSTTVGVASTSVINIRAVEDLGGGMKVTAQYGIDPRLVANDSAGLTNASANVSSRYGTTGCLPNTNASGTAGTGSATACTLGNVNVSSNTNTAIGRDELFVGIEGGFGNLRLGSPNSIGLNTFQNGSPLGTGIGSGYTGGGTSGTMTNSFVQTRYSRSVRWDSPAMSGFTLSAMYIPGNDQAATTTIPSTVTITSAVNGAQTVGASVPNANLILNARAASEVGLRYTQGPLTVAYANISQDVQINSTGWYANGSSTTGEKTNAQFLTASYAFNGGNTTVYAGWNDGDRLAPLGAAGGTAAGGNATVTSKGNRMAIKHTMGPIDLMASQTTQEALGVTGTATGTGAAAYTTGVITAKVNGLRADYNLSKTSAVYVGYERYLTGAAYTNTALTTTGDRTITSMGLKKQF